jgi:peptidoglycan/LPS O-acetylase OafA/YrhL
MSLHKPHTFVVLDALRGLGACVVMEAHLARFFNARVLPHAHIAVDFFSMLSGFVLTYAYQERLDHGWSLRSFVKMRFIRVYPIYILGLTLGFLFNVVRDHFGKVHLIAYGPMGLIFVIGLLLLPVPPQFQPGGPALYPFDVPAWSLFFELIVNLCHAILIRRRGWIFLTVSALIWAGILQHGILQRGTLGFGAYRSDLFYGLARILFSYLVGMLVLLLWKTGKFNVRLSPLVPVILLAALVLIPDTRQIAIHCDLLLLITALPLVILLSADSKLPRWFMPPARLLGTSSYSVYLLHVPIAGMFEQAWKHMTRHTIESSAPWSGILCAIVVFLVAIGVDRFYDLPVRTLLRRRWVGKPSIYVAHRGSRLVPSTVALAEPVHLLEAIELPPAPTL